MTFIEAVGTCLKKYATFSGRASRSEFWWFELFFLAVTLACSLMDVALGSSAGLGSGLVGSIAALALMMPAISVSVRRLHDTGRSGWWYWILCIPLAGAIAFAWFCCQNPCEGEPNRFGSRE